MKEKKSKFAFLLLILPLLLLSFGGLYYYKTFYTKTRFEHFLDESFQYIATENALTLHMTLQYPEKYGIDMNQTTLLPDLSDQACKERYAHYQSMLDQLHQFSMKNLSQDQQFLALLFEYNLKEYLTMEKEFPYYETNLGANGNLVDLAILFSEFSFEDRDDIVLYEKLLNKLPDYLDSMADYEIRRQKAGIYPSSSLIEGTLQHIDQLLGSEDSNLYLDSFQNRIKEATFLSNSEKKTYLKKNETLVKKMVIPSYKKIQSLLKEKLEVLKKNLTISSYPKGKAYYTHLLTSETGSNLSPEECYDIFSKEIEEQQKKIEDIYKENPDIELDYLTSFPAIDQANDILEDLKNVTRIEFPAIKDLSCDLSEISTNLNSISASAYYITPPFGYEGSNHISLQGYSSSDLSLYTTLAHEGYPGHLYQTNYFYQHMIHPIQLYLKCPGFNEGWGTYAEYYSYDFLAIKDMDEKTSNQVKSLLKANHLLNLNISCMADIMVNYLGYDVKDLTKYMKSLNIEENASEQIYHYVVENPCSYLKYGIGYYEFMELLQSEKKNPSFSMLDFHTKILSYGSCPFDLLRTMMNQDKKSLSFVDNNE
ncbi:MAG: DUF885 family protein [Eubacteriales bacterium]|nr:DUF885 family protein [Eubacteriales bacterium]